MANYMYLKKKYAFYIFLKQKLEKLPNVVSSM
jgi:hypothetical protein